jgi:hypothetical protein
MDTIKSQSILINKKISKLIINNNELYTDQICRIKYIEKFQNDLLEMIDNLKISFELNKNSELSDEIINKIQEDLYNEEIIKKFTPYILAYSVSNNI